MFGALISGINGVGHSQAGHYVSAEFAGAIAVGWLLIRRQLTQAMPLLPVDLFRRPIFALSVTTSVCSFVAQGIAFVALPFYFHDVIGASAVATGLLMTPWMVMTATMAPIAGRLADRYPAGILGGLGLSVLAAGFVLLALLPAQPTTTDIIWRVAICGLGFGLFQSPNNRAIVASAPQRRRRRDPGHGAPAGPVDRRRLRRPCFRPCRGRTQCRHRDPAGRLLRCNRGRREPDPPVRFRAPRASDAPIRSHGIRRAAPARGVAFHDKERRVPPDRTVS